MCLSSTVSEIKVEFSRKLHWQCACTLPRDRYVVGVNCLTEHENKREKDRGDEG